MFSAAAQTKDWSKATESDLEAIFFIVTLDTVRATVQDPRTRTFRDLTVSEA